MTRAGSKGWMLPVAAGLCMGLLIGLLLGLSATPVVGVVMGALVAAASAYWSLTPTPQTGTPASPMSIAARQAATTALCLACIIGVGAGLWMRTRDVFSPTPDEQVKLWTQAGFNAEDARAIVVLRVAGITKDGVTARPEAANKALSTLLFSGRTTECRQVDPADFQQSTDLAAAFRNTGAHWAAFADIVGRSGASGQHDLLRAAWELACR